MGHSVLTILKEYTIAAESVLPFEQGKDWLINTGTVYIFEDRPITFVGGVGLELVKVTEETGDVVAGGSSLISAFAGGALAADTAIVLTGAATPEALGLSASSEGLMVVGSSGFNPLLSRSIAAISRPTLGAGEFRAAAIRS